MKKDTAAPYFEILNNSISASVRSTNFLSCSIAYLDRFKDPHDKKGMICKDPEVNSNFQEVFYFLKIRVYFP